MNQPFYPPLTSMFVYSYLGTSSENIAIKIYASLISFEVRIEGKLRKQIERYNTTN